MPATISPIIWKEHNGSIAPFVQDRCEHRRAAWAAFPGSQELVLTCPVFELLYEGTRGPGKSETMLMDFGQHCGIGFHSEWRGILFRRTYKQLSDIISKSRRLYPRIFPDARFIASDSQLKWVWPGGEELLFRVFKRPADYDDYHGHEYTWICFDELTRWATDEGFKLMLSCCRSAHPGITLADGQRMPVPLKVRATTNPYGIGHNWVKERYRLPGHRGRIIPGDFDTETGVQHESRVAIFGHLSENLVLKRFDPRYLSRIVAAARNPSERKAWAFGSWDVNAGGMFDDIWSSPHHIVPDLTVPKAWRLDRSFDWGSSKPFSVCWWAESDGSPLRFNNGRVMQTLSGDLFLVREWYGCRQNAPNEGLRMIAKDIAKGIREREDNWFPHRQVAAGPADSSIFDDVNGVSIERDMKQAGVRWTRSNKNPGSRRQGWQKLRDLLTGSIPSEPGHPREEPGMFISELCEHFIRTVPKLPRCEEDLDDVDTDSEDHIGDATRYRIYQRRGELKVKAVSGR